MENDVLVSVVCLTYNQEKYIRRAIESFLSQRTNFKYEILINDDASTDETANIIREYEMKYPDYIKPTYQSENQYTKGIKIAASFLYPQAKGKYIALCEGDDFWTDQLKLQKQVDFLEKNETCSLCVHGAVEVDAETLIARGKVCPSKKNRYFTTEEIIIGDGCIFATNSMVFRKQYSDTLPKFYYEAPVGDYPLMIYLSLCGAVYYMKDNMSAYRREAEGSWTKKLEKSDAITKINVLTGIEKMLADVDIYTNKQFTSAINEVITKKRIVLFYKMRCLFKLKEPEYIQWYNELPWWWKCVIHFMNCFPKLTSRTLKVRRYIKNG